MSVGDGQERMLICGDVEGNFEALFSRLEQILRKVGKFEQLFVCGEFFGSDADENKRILKGEFVIPVPIYILGPTKPDTAKYFTVPAGGTLAPNIIYLGRKGVFHTASGMSVAYFSGRQGDYQDECHFSADTIKEFIVQMTAGTDYTGVDILLTSQWPASVDKYTSHTPDVYNEDQLHMSPLISKLAAHLKPRYHFAAMTNCHYERPPYRNHRVLQESARHCTRFVGLARCGNPLRLKWIYAFNIAPMKYLDHSKLVEEPNNVTEFPYAEVVQELDAKDYMKQAVGRRNEEQQNQYFYDVTIAGDDGGGDYQERGGRKRRQHQRRGDFFDGAPANKKAPPGPCWFCLSSSEVEKHLIVSIADHTYMALAKGALVTDHVLLLPIEHVQSLVTCSADIMEELDKYKQALERYFKDQGKVPVYFERNYRTHHLQLQVVPVPFDKAHAVRPAFDKVAALHDVAFSELPDNMQITDVIREGCPYFYAELPYGQKIYSRSMKHFSTQFGREVMASEELLNMEGRIDWRACVLSKEEETQVTLKVRQAFAKYDFNHM